MFRRSHYLLLFLSILSLAQVLSGSWFNEWPSGDESWHYAWSERFFESGETERVSTTHFQSTTPITLANVISKKVARRLGITDGMTQVFISRLPGVVILGITYWCFYFFVKGYFGDNVALLATLIVILDMNLIAHSSVIAVDLAFTLATLLAIWAFMAYADGERPPSVERAAVCGLAIGFAFAVKYTAVLLVLLYLPILAYAAQRLSRQGTPKGRVAIALLGHAGVAALVAIFVINVAYGFSGFFRLSSLQLYSGFFRGLAQTGIVMPFPEAFVSGLDKVLAVERYRPSNTVIAGRYFDNGVWYYFLLLWLLKTPISLVATGVFGTLLLAARPAEWLRNTRLIYILICFIVFVGYFSLIFRMQVGFRYALMAVPLGAILIACGVANLSKGFQRDYSRYIVLLVALVALAESLPYLGNPLSFSNSLILPKKDAFRWLADSNIDWFQNTQRDRNTISKRFPGAVLDPPHIVPGINFFTLNRLVGVWRNFEQHKWLRDHVEPFGHINHTVVGFDVSQVQFEEFLAQDRAFSEPVSAKSACPETITYRTLERTGEIAIQQATSRKTFASVCLRVEAHTVLEITALMGSNRLGLYAQDGECVGEKLDAGQSLWFSLSPGVFPVCLYGANPAKLSWTVHGSGATALSYGIKR